jgi:hypothetical protein
VAGLFVWRFKFGEVGEVYPHPLGFMLLSKVC